MKWIFLCAQPDQKKGFRCLNCEVKPYYEGLLGTLLPKRSHYHY